MQSATLDAAKMQDGRSRKPFLWAPSKEDEFNLTELIDSVERKIWLLEEMENRPIAANSLLSLKSESETTEEDLLLTLPGYKPKKVTPATRLDPKGNFSSTTGCTSGCDEPPVDIKTRVPFGQNRPGQYGTFVFKSAGGSSQPDVSPCSDVL